MDKATMKVVICGGHGQVGSEFGTLSTERIRCLRMSSSELNITDADSIDAVLESHRPDIIINTAAYTAVDKAESEPELAYTINGDGAGNLASACAKRDIPLIHLSTDYVFSGDKSEPYVESDPTDPQGVYGASKLAGENAIRQACEKHLILRVSWVFGQHGHNFVKTMLRLAADRDELSVVADQLGAPTAARSIAVNCLNAAESLVNTSQFDWGIHHLPSLPYTNWHRFAEAIFQRAAEKNLISKVPKLNAITTAEYPTAAARPANSRLATEKQHKLLPCDWQAELDGVLAALA